MSTTETIEVNLPTEVQDFAKKCLGRSNPRSFLIPLLHRLQDIEGYLKSEHLREVAKLIGTFDFNLPGYSLSCERCWICRREDRGASWDKRG
jgi:NADH:ubiquinone oxidoreductase subunit E